MKQYLISKENYNGEVVYLNIDKKSGYKVSPKNTVTYDGIKVNEMIFIKPDLIQKIIKRKIKNRLDLYLKFLLSDESDDDTRKALGDLQRYRVFVKDKYEVYLNPKYIALLNNKLDILERNLKSKIVTSSLKNSYQNEYVGEHKRSR